MSGVIWLLAIIIVEKKYLAVNGGNDFISTEFIRQRHKSSYDDGAASSGCVVNYKLPAFFAKSHVKN